MRIHELDIATKTARKRVGRGISAGGGKTAGRGTKGQKARTGKKLKPGFEGGQTKLAMRLPKARGFKHAPNVSYQTINLQDLARHKATTVTAQSLAQAGIAKYADRPVKLLGDGEVSTAFKLTVQAATTQAINAVEKVGGSVTIAALPKTTKATADTKKSDK